MRGVVHSSGCFSVPDGNPSECRAFHQMSLNESGNETINSYNHIAFSAKWKCTFVTFEKGDTNSKNLEPRKVIF